MDSALRVLHVLPSLEMGGAELYVQRLAAAHDPSRVQARVCALHRGGPVAERLTALGIPWEVLAIQRRSVRMPHLAFWDLLRLARGLRQQVLQHDIQLLQTHLADADWLGILAARRSRIPALLTFHSVRLLPAGRAEQGGRASLRRTLQRLLYPHAAAFVGVGAEVEEVLAAHPGIDPARIHRVASAIELGPVPTPEEIKQAREKHREGGAGPILLTLGRLVASKGVKRLLPVLREVQRKRPGAKLWVIGEGPERPSLEQCARDLGVSQAVRFLGLQMQPREYLLAADLFLTGSHHEGLGLAPLEAQALGVPVVAYQVSGIREVVADGVTGVLLPDGDEPGMVRAVLELLADPARHAELSRAGRTQAAKYDVSRSCRQTEELYSELLAAR